MTESTSNATILNFDVIFKLVCSGIRVRAYTSDFDKYALIDGVKTFIEDYSSQLEQWQAKEKPRTVEEFNAAVQGGSEVATAVRNHLLRGVEIEYDEARLNEAFFTPYVKKYYYLDPAFGDDLNRCADAYKPSQPNTTLMVFMKDGKFGCLLTDMVPLAINGMDKFYCLPFSIYEEGTLPHENVTDFARDYFRKHYNDESISKWDVFYYIYALFHHPDYIKTYPWEGELPRVPLVESFWKFRAIGARLGKLHLGYERNSRFKLHWKQTAEGLETISFRVMEMILHQEHSNLPPKANKNPTRSAFYRKKAAEAKERIARELWHPQTPAASLLWEALRDGRLDNLDFQRVASRKNPSMFTAFRCSAANLRLEITGMYGEEGRRNAPDGGLILYITNNDIFNMLEEVLVHILMIVDEQLPQRITDTQVARQVTTAEVEQIIPDRDYKTYNAVRINNTLTLENIPQEAYDYRLAGKSALEWLIDGYQVHVDDVTGREMDPNTFGGTDAQYLIKLFERVLNVSVETAKIMVDLRQRKI